MPSKKQSNSNAMKSVKNPKIKLSEDIIKQHNANKREIDDLQKQIEKLEKQRSEKEKIVAKADKQVKKEATSNEVRRILDSINNNETLGLYGYKATLKSSRGIHVITIAENVPGKKVSKPKRSINLKWDGAIREDLSTKIAKGKYYTKKELDDLCVSVKANPMKFWKEPDGAKVLIKIDNSPKAIDYKKELKLKGLAKIYIKS